MQAVLCISKKNFDELAPKLQQLWMLKLAQKPQRQRKVGAGQKGALLTGADKLLFILFYLKVYPTFDLMEVFFNLDHSRCCRWVHDLLPLLEKLLDTKHVLPKRRIGSVAEFHAAFPCAREVIIDGMERPIQRPSKPSSNRKHYSGKKKRHTRKALVMTDSSKRIGYLSPSRRGTRHDKKLLDKEHLAPHLPPEVEVFVDSGFEGLKHPRLCIPKKSSRHHPLDVSEKFMNRLISSVRVGVEHVIGGMKRLGCVAQIYRNRRPQADDRFNVLGAALWNLSLA